VSYEQAAPGRPHCGRRADRGGPSRLGGRTRFGRRRGQVRHPGLWDAPRLLGDCYRWL